MANRVRLAIGSDRRDLALIDSVVAGFAKARGVPHADAVRLTQVARRLTEWVTPHAYPEDPSGEIVVQLEVVEGGVRCTIEDWGEPIGAFGGTLANLPADLADVAAITKGLRLVNLGGDGKRLSATVAAAGVTAEPEVTDEHTVRQTPSAPLTADQVAIRETRAEDAEGVSRLLYATYGLSYVHGDFYRPQWIAEQIEAGRVLSSVALLGGEVIGHQALLYDQTGAALEIGVAAVHPLYRGMGIASRLMAHGVERARAMGAVALLSRSVTHHPYSQRAERAAGFRTTGLMLAAAPAGFARASRRTAVLMAYLPFHRAPRPVSLPSRYAAPLAAAYANLALDLAPPDPAAGLAQLDGLPSVVMEQHAMTGAAGLAMITLGRWGEPERHDLIEALRETVHRKVDVAYCDLDLHSLATPALDVIVELLGTHDFFYCGLGAFGRAGHDHLRMQAMLTDQIEVDAMILDSEYARDLRRVVLADLHQLAP